VCGVKGVRVFCVLFGCQGLRISGWGLGARDWGSRLGESGQV
jgi:hypothetical protein